MRHASRPWDGETAINSCAGIAFSNTGISWFRYQQRLCGFWLSPWLLSLHSSCFTSPSLYLSPSLLCVFSSTRKQQARLNGIRAEVSWLLAGLFTIFNNGYQYLWQSDRRVRELAWDRSVLAGNDSLDQCNEELCWLRSRYSLMAATC